MSLNFAQDSCCTILEIACNLQPLKMVPGRGEPKQDTLQANMEMSQ